MLKGLSFLFLVLALVPYAVELLTRRAYPLPPSGGAAIVISGASTGIGYDAAVNLADDFVVYAGVRKETDAETLRAAGKPTLVPVMLDVTKQESVDAAYETITKDAEKRGIPVWGLVNNAGIMTASSVENHGLEDMYKTFDVNLWGATRLTNAFLPLLRANAGRLIQISSVAGFVTIPRAATYCASKHALEALTDGLRMELERYNVSVTSVQPGAVRSAIFDKSVETAKAKLAKDPREMAVYGHLIKQDDADNNRMLERADTPEVTTKAIRDSLLSQYPKTRVIVANIDGLPAWVLGKMKLVLPDRVMDRMLLAAFT